MSRLNLKKGKCNEKQINCLNLNYASRKWWWWLCLTKLPLDLCLEKFQSCQAFVDLNDMQPSFCIHVCFCRNKLINKCNLRLAELNFNSIAAMSCIMINSI